MCILEKKSESTVSFPLFTLFGARYLVRQINPYFDKKKHALPKPSVTIINRTNFFEVLMFQIRSVLDVLKMKHIPFNTPLCVGIDWEQARPTCRAVCKRLQLESPRAFLIEFRRFKCDPFPCYFNRQPRSQQTMSRVRCVV